MGMLRALALGLIFGGVYWRRPFDQLGIVERLSALYFLSGECLVYVTYDVYIGCVCASVWLVCVCVCVCLCSAVSLVYVRVRVLALGLIFGGVHWRRSYSKCF